MSDLVGNHKDQFSHVAAHRGIFVKTASCKECSRLIESYHKNVVAKSDTCFLKDLSLSL